MAEMEQYMDKLRDLQKKSVNDQAATFLRAFCLDFAGKFEEVFTLADEYKSADPENGVGGSELEEDKAHMFLEAKDETMTVVALREALNAIDLNKNGRMSFVEYLMWKYQKTLEALFSEDECANKELLAELNAAIAIYNQFGSEKSDHDKEIERLEALVEAGGVKGLKAKAELEILRQRRWTLVNKGEVEAKVKVKKAEKAVAEATGTDQAKEEAYAAEQKRLEEERLAAEAAEKQKKDESRQRLKDRAKMFEQQ
mmetsp:Transcript_41569/g.50416  ORF Transcript_41569/g.50416 Transcript_41569/m.50416 type:complete len:255 (-) Transcript_41569:524-1288(-)|eukprot:CAMPEP_0197845624 /NCGR_PEP_ID=MMETSP1438-20131217/2534_1 /TAXON_ID=1461541 /ORGANISM="Pterosperma sp., Strain CCMP1384" /LENGTH=254 /DNA_ID=CAMNT_0043456995 /DNA_START=79 /DNA_END=843 /DNA_ORIENTATION=+